MVHFDAELHGFDGPVLSHHFGEVLQFGGVLELELLRVAGSPEAVGWK
jgi:hypothetical protein